MPTQVQGGFACWLRNWVIKKLMSSPGKGLDMSGRDYFFPRSSEIQMDSKPNLALVEAEAPA